MVDEDSLRAVHHLSHHLNEELLLLVASKPEIGLDNFDDIHQMLGISLLFVFRQEWSQGASYSFRDRGVGVSSELNEHGKKVLGHTSHVEQLHIFMQVTS